MLQLYYSQLLWIDRSCLVIRVTHSCNRVLIIRIVLLLIIVIIIVIVSQSLGVIAVKDHATSNARHVERNQDHTIYTFKINGPTVF